MRKIYTFVCMVLLGLGANTMAQENLVSLPHIESAPGALTIEVEYDFTAHDVCAFEIAITFNTDELTYLGYSEGDISDDNDFQINESTPGTIDLVWSKVTPITNAGILVNLEFDYFGTEGTTDLEFLSTSFNPGHFNPVDNPSWLASCATVAGAQVLSTTFADGSITYTKQVPLSSRALLLSIVLMATFLLVRLYRLW